jgi:hypothetical protein
LGQLDVMYVVDNSSLVHYDSMPVEGEIKSTADGQMIYDNGRWYHYAFCDGTKTIAIEWYACASTLDTMTSKTLTFGGFEEHRTNANQRVADQRDADANQSVLSISIMVAAAVAYTILNWRM